MRQYASYNFLQPFPFTCTTQAKISSLGGSNDPNRKICYCILKQEYLDNLYLLTSFQKWYGTKTSRRQRWQKYTEEVCKKDLHDPDNHDGVITHLEPDILECEVKWAIGSITMNKASEGDGIPVELFQILKDDAVKVLHSICISGHRIGKGQFSFQSLRRATPKNAQTIAQLHSSHTLVK